MQRKYILRDNAGVPSAGTRCKSTEPAGQRMCEMLKLIICTSKEHIWVKNHSERRWSMFFHYFVVGAASWCDQRHPQFWDPIWELILRNELDLRLAINFAWREKILLQANRHEYRWGDNVTVEQGVFTHLDRWLVVSDSFSPQQLDHVVANVSHVTAISSVHNIKVILPHIWAFQLHASAQKEKAETVFLCRLNKLFFFFCIAL